MKEHGYYSVGRSEQLVLFSGRGPWNDETMRRGTVETGLLIQQLNKTCSWGQISLLSGESIMPPSTFSAFSKQTLVRKQIGMTALAVVIKNSNITNTIKVQLSQAYELADIEHQFFDCLDEALIWIKKLNIQYNNQAVQHSLSNNTLTQILTISTSKYLRPKEQKPI